MKKLIVAIIALFFATSTAFANVKIGVSGTGAEFSDAAGHEEHKGVVTSESAEIGAAVVVFGSLHGRVVHVPPGEPETSQYQIL